MDRCLRLRYAVIRQERPRQGSVHSINFALSLMIFTGVFDYHACWRIGLVEHETAWIPYWLKQIDCTYREWPMLTRGQSVLTRIIFPIIFSVI